MWQTGDDCWESFPALWLLMLRISLLLYVIYMWSIIFHYYWLSAGALAVNKGLNGHWIVCENLSMIWWGKFYGRPISKNKYLYVLLCHSFFDTCSWRALGLLFLLNSYLTGMKDSSCVRPCLLKMNQYWLNTNGHRRVSRVIRWSFF